MRCSPLCGHCLSAKMCVENKWVISFDCHSHWKYVNRHPTMKAEQAQAKLFCYLGNELVMRGSTHNTSHLTDDMTAGCAPTPECAPTATPWICQPRLGCWGYFSQQGGTLISHSYVAYIIAIYTHITHQSFSICLRRWDDSHRLVSPVTPCICCDTHKNLQQGSLLLLFLYCGAAKDHEPWLQAWERALLQYTHRDTQKTTAVYLRLTNHSFPMLSSRRMGRPYCHVEQQERSSSRKMPSVRSFSTETSWEEWCTKEERISSAAVIRFLSSKYSKGMGLLKHVLPIFYSSLPRLQQRSALSYLLLSALQGQLRNQHIFCSVLAVPFGCIPAEKLRDHNMGTLSQGEGTWSARKHSSNLVNKAAMEKWRRSRREGIVKRSTCQDTALPAAAFPHGASSFIQGVHCT